MQKVLVVLTIFYCVTLGACADEKTTQVQIYSRALNECNAQVAYWRNAEKQCWSARDGGEYWH